jgi:hypothetical protein
MSSAAVRLYGRDAAVELVREFLTRDERDGELYSRRCPVLVFTGPRGIGKTALLADLARQLDQQVPYVRVDCESFGGGARELLSLLAFELNKHSGRYGTLPFPRLITGQIAIAARLDMTEREVARSQVQRVLEDHQKVGELLQEALSDMIESGFEAAGGAHGIPGAGVAVNDLSKYGPGLVLGALARTRRGRRLLLGKGQEWYCHQDRGLARNSLDELVNLNRMAARPDAEDNRREVAELLWAAFLADLRNSFQHARRAGDWTLNCAVLLDNADTAVGHDFLNELVMARRQQAAHAADTPDPLTVVAASRGSLSERVRPRGEDIATLAAAGYPDYTRRSSRTQLGTWWYPVMLPDLTADETGNMVAALGLPGSRHAVTSVVHRFTSGHPGSTRVLLDAMAEHPDSPADLLAILEGPEPGVLAARRRTVEESLLERLIEGIPGEAAEDLVTCAAARHKEAALRLAADSGLMIQPWGEDSVIFAAGLWDAAAAAGSSPGTAGTGPAAGAPAELHPVLRRLLSGRLGARAADAPAGWAQVHGWLRANSQSAGDETAELYHALALGETEHVARQFAKSLEYADVPGWLRGLRLVTAAPNRLDHRQAPASQVRALTGWADQRELPIGPVGRLVAAAWIDADPLSTGHRQRLRRAMAADLEQIAPYSTDLAAIRDEAGRYRDDDIHGG